MPVLVTAADEPLSRRIAARILEEGGEVRVVSTGDTSALRAAGAFVATATWDDEGRLEAALADVHTLVHVGGVSLADDPDQVAAAARVAARAATNAGVKRVIALSLAGAAPDAQDPLRRAKAAAEAAFAAVPCPSVVVRTSLLDTPEARDLLGTGGLGPDELAVEVAPVRTADVAELVVAFDRARATATEGHLVVAADGPLRTSVVAYLDRVGAGRPGTGSLVGRRLPDESRLGRARDVLHGGPWWSDVEVGALDGWQFAGLTPSAPGVT